MGDTVKVCPLMIVGRVDQVMCVGKNCAWWDHMIGACFICLTNEERRAFEETVQILAKEKHQKVEQMGAAVRFGEKMTENGKRMAESFEHLLSQLDEPEKERLLIFGEGMAFKAAMQQQAPAPEQGQG